MTNKNKNKRQKLSKRHATQQQSRRYPFSPHTRLYDLVSAKYHTTLAAWLELIAPYLRDGTAPNWKTARRLDFQCRDECIARCLAFFKIKFYKEGLKCKWSIFIRYITSCEHSNIRTEEQSLITLINSMIRGGMPPIN